MATQSAGGMTPAALRALPPTVPLWPTAAQVLGVGRSTAYEMARSGEWPTRLLRLGKLIRVPTAELLAYVGADQPTNGGTAA
jgi:excisionase family DNA binding protein